MALTTGESSGRLAQALIILSSTLYIATDSVEYTEAL